MSINTREAVKVSHFSCLLIEITRWLRHFNVVKGSDA